MRATTKKLLALVVATMFCLQGCSKVVIDRNVEVGPMEVKHVNVDPPKKEQKLKVTIASPDAPVNVYIVLEKDIGLASRQMEDFRKPANALAGQDQASDATLEATIPANEGFAILFRHKSQRAANVRLKIDGQ